jgi:hypothetical protein
VTVKRKTKTHDVLKLRSTVKKAIDEQKRWAYLAAAHEYIGAPVSFDKLVEVAEKIREYTAHGNLPPAKQVSTVGTVVTTIKRDGTPF